MQRYLGLDLGDKTIGVAVSDPLGLTAQAVTVIRRTSEARDLQQLQALLDEYEVREIVLGLPKNMNGTIGFRGQISIEYAALIQEKLKVPVALYDERLTTVAATRTLLQADMSRAKRKQVIDKMAAALMLQTFLDSRPKG